MDTDRRLYAKRASITRRVVNELVHKRAAVVTIEGLRDYLDVPSDAAARIIRNLVRAGLFAEIRSGVWMNVVCAW
jgi:predicted transcriptional regulator of viral defense system